MIDQVVKIRLPNLYPVQRAAFFHKARYVVVEASTKSGKTVGCIAWILAQAINNGGDGREFWWIAPTYDVAKIAFRRIRRMFARVDPGKQVWGDNKSDITISLANGSVLRFKGADDPDKLYGEDVYAAVIDEATRCKAEAWHAIRSTLTATRGPIRIIGNVKGKKNWAYREARAAQSGEPNMHYAKITAQDAVSAGILDADEVADAKRRLPSAVYKELYLSEPSDDEGNPFGIKAIRSCIAPLSEAPPAVFGVDLAKSHDWCVSIGLDDSGAVCVYDRWQGDWKNTRNRILSQVNGWPCLIDSTGVGDPIVEDLRRVRANVVGFKFTASSKQQLMEGLAVAIQRQEVGFPQGQIVNELEAFEYEYTRTGVRYTAPEGLHDDCVCALALAVMQRQRIAGGVVGVGLAADDGDEYDPDEEMWNET